MTTKKEEDIIKEITVEDANTDESENSVVGG